MKIAFTGDLVLQNIHFSPKDVFGDLKDYIESHKVKLVLNLESPFIDKNATPIKNKITIHADSTKIEYLYFLKPYLINLSNNHINDFGNLSCKYTIDLLEKYGLPNFGIGLKDELKNIFFDYENKYVILSYTMRSSDFTCEKLFAEDNFIGPYSLDLMKIREIKKSYPDYQLIVTIHWGIEDIKFPETEKRKLAYDIIDTGADIILGHHPHIIQPYEIYKNKFIFYSLGNFLFPNIQYSIKDRKYNKNLLPHQKKGIVPIIEIKDGTISLFQLLYISQNRGKLKYKTNYKLFKMNYISNKYVFRNKYYLYLQQIKNYVFFILYNPGRVFNKLLYIITRIIK
jgi:poly-gamma-glutamate synthesis protein (capsule biosynthesis protein)